MFAARFDPIEPDLPRKTLSTPPGLLDGLRVSTPERAVLEMLHDVGTHEPLDEARGVFAMKGGTALNFFVHDMPRLSGDIDLACTAWATPRNEALREVAGELAAPGADRPRRAVVRRRRCR